MWYSCLIIYRTINKILRAITLKIIHSYFKNFFTLMLIAKKHRILSSCFPFPNHKRVVQDVESSLVNHCHSKIHGLL